MFPKLRRKGRTLPSMRNGEENTEEESTDYVFRIVNKARHEDFCKFLNSQHHGFKICSFEVTYQWELILLSFVTLNGIL